MSLFTISLSTVFVDNKTAATIVHHVTGSGNGTSGSGVANTATATNMSIETCLVCGDRASGTLSNIMYMYICNNL